MPTKKLPAAKKSTASKSAVTKTAPVAKKASAKKAAQPATAATFRTKIDVANLAVGAKTVKQLARAFAKLAQTLGKMDESGVVKLEQPVTAKGVHLATTDAKAAKRFGMEEGRSPRGAKTAVPVAKKTAAVKAAKTQAPAPAKKAGAKKASAKKARAQAAPADAAAVSEAADVAASAVKTRAVKKAAAKKAPAKTAARKAKLNGSNQPARAADGTSAAAPEAPPATDTPGAEVAAS